MIRWNYPTRQARSLPSRQWHEWRPIRARCLSVVGMLGFVLLSYGPVRAAESGTPPTRCKRPSTG